MTLKGWSFETPLLELAGTVAVGIALWLAALAATRHPLSVKLKALKARP